MRLTINIGRLKEGLKAIFAITLLYCFLFNPPFAFLPVGLTKFMYIMALPFLFRPEIKRVYKSNFLLVTLLMVLYICYSCFVHLTFLSEASYLQINFFILFESFFTAYVIAYFLVEYYKEKADLVVLWTTIVASFITLILILSPDLNTYVRESLLIEGSERLKDMYVFRGFGMADDLFFTYPIALSIGMCICMEYARKNSLYYVFILSFLVGIFFNARIGIIPFAIYWGYIIFLERKFSILIKISLAVLLIFIIVLKSGILEEYENTMEWIIEGFSDFGSLMEGEASGNFEILSSMIIIPNNFLELLFGTGKDLYLAHNNSDIGYILQLNFGGIFYISLFFLLVFKLFQKLKKNNISKNKWFNLVFIGTILICNIKGYFFYTCSGLRMLMLLFFVYTLSSDKIQGQRIQ